MRKAWQVLRDFFRTMWRVIRKSPGGIFVEESLQQDRHSICQDCLVYNPDLDMCEVCFCQMSVKTRLRESQCPRGLW